MTCIDIERDLQLASYGTEEDLQFLAHHPSSDVLLALLRNKNTTEEIALTIASRKDVRPEVLEFLFNDMRWKGNYNISLAFCKNPKTPQRISISLITSLKIFDVADLTRSQFVPVSVRMKAELEIIEKIPAMPLGTKISLAKRASGSVLVRLMEEGETEVIAACLDSSYMTEGEIYKILNKKTVPPQVIHQIAEHPRWSCRYQIQWALIRNNHAPLSRVVDFLKNIKTNELKELYKAPEVPSSTKPFIYSELLERKGD